MIEAEHLKSELSRLGERPDLLVQSVTDHAIYMLDRRGVIASWNAGAQRCKGYTADEIVGQNVSRFYEEADRLAKIPEKALETAEKEGRFEAEGWGIRKDGGPACRCGTWGLPVSQALWIHAISQDNGGS